MDSRRFVPTDIGKIVNRFLTHHFHRYVEYGFTAAMEDELDAVSRGEEEWTTPLEKFWKPFIHQVDKIERTVTREQVAQARELGKDPASGKPVTVRMGRYRSVRADRHQGRRGEAALRRPASGAEDGCGHARRRAWSCSSCRARSARHAEGEAIVANVGRFGPYVKYGSKYASLKEDDPYTVTLERALEVIRLKKEADANRIIQGFRRRRHPGAERALRALHHRQEEERQDPQGSRSEVAHARGMPRAARGGARARRRFGRWGRRKRRHRGACRRRRRRCSRRLPRPGASVRRTKKLPPGPRRSRRSRPAAASSTCRQGTRPLARGSRQVSGRGSARRAWAREAQGFGAAAPPAAGRQGAASQDRGQERKRQGAGEERRPGSRSHPRGEVTARPCGPFRACLPAGAVNGRETHRSPPHTPAHRAAARARGWRR